MGYLMMIFDHVSCTVSIGRMIGKTVGIKWSWPHPNIFVEGLRKV
jgi:hypothetical protein